MTTKRLKILIVSSAKCWAGGEIYAIRLAEEMQKRGHEIGFVCLPGTPLEEELKKRRLHYIPGAPRNSGDIASVIRMASHIRRHGWEVIHGHVGRDYVPVVLAGILADRPAIITRHLLNPMKTASRWALRRAARVVAVSQAVADVLTAESGLPERLVTTLLTGIDTSQFRPGESARSLLPSLGIPGEAMVIGAVNRLHEGKRIDILLQAAAIVNRDHPNARLVMIGDGHLRDQVETMIQDLGLTGVVTLAGFRSDVDRLLPEFDLFCLASDREPLGYVVLEAMACGLPVIASRSGGVVEAVVDGETGLLFEPGSADSMAAAMSALIEDRGRAKAMGMAGRARVEREFSQSHMMDTMAAIYEEVVHTAAPGP